MYVGVKHKPEHNKLFWFSVPDSMAHKVSLGSRVICDTKKGKTDGVVCSVNNNVLDDSGVREITSNHKLKRIVGVKCDMNINDIVIPRNFANSVIHEELITKRLEEFEKTGAFNTNIVVKANGRVMRDGYSAYIAAKRLGRSTLRCLLTV